MSLGLFVALILGGFPALAEDAGQAAKGFLPPENMAVDHRCLQTCLDDGANRYQCMGHCRYVDVQGKGPGGPSSYPGVGLSANREFSTPIPLTNGQIENNADALTQPRAANPAESATTRTGTRTLSTAGGGCLAVCLQAGYQYQRCKQGC